MSDTIKLNLFLDEPFEDQDSLENSNSNTINHFSQWETNKPQPHQASRLGDFVNAQIPTPNKPKKLIRNIDNFKHDKQLNIKIFGVGGAGNNMINHMAQYSNINKETLYAINTDLAVLRNMPEDVNAILIGNRITNGYGSGSDPEIGRNAALEDEALLREILEDTDLLFIVSGMGKGTGTGASPVIAQIAKDMGILTLSTVNLPSYSIEGPEIFQKGQIGLQNLANSTNGILTVSNEKLFIETSAQISLKDAFNYADSVISKIIYEITTLITCASEINVDFNDVKSFFKESTTFQLNTFEFNDIENIEQDIMQQLSNEIYQDNLQGSRKVIINYKLNPKLNRDFITKFSDALMNITNNKSLNITYAINYFDNVECAIASVLIAKDKTENVNFENVNPVSKSRQTGDVQTQAPAGTPVQHNVPPPPPPPLAKPAIPQPIEEIEIINTKTEELEATKHTIQIPQEVHETNKQFQILLSEFSELTNDINDNEAQQEKQKLAEASHATRKNFIKTNTLENGMHAHHSRTVRISHPSADMNRERQ